jgi:hypothetical protein
MVRPKKLKSRTTILSDPKVENGAHDRISLCRSVFTDGREKFIRGEARVYVGPCWPSVRWKQRPEGGIECLSYFIKGENADFGGALPPRRLIPLVPQSVGCLDAKRCGDNLFPVTKLVSLTISWQRRHRQTDCHFPRRVYRRSSTAVGEAHRSDGVRCCTRIAGASCAGVTCGESKA